MGKKYRCPKCKTVIMKSRAEQAMGKAKGIIFGSDPGKKNVQLVANSLQKRI